MIRDNILSNKNNLPAINISLGGGLACNVDNIRALVLMRADYPEWFYDNVRITSIFDCFPGMIWNGGRHVLGSISMDDAEEHVNFFNQRGIGVNFTFTNCLLTENHIKDELCNAVLRMFENPLNGIIVNNKQLEAHIRQIAPQYKIISSVTKYIFDKAKLHAETREYDLVVIPPEYNHDYEFLGTLPPDKVELSFLEPCQGHCPDRVNHWVYESKVTLGLLPPNERTFVSSCCKMTNEMDLSLPEMLNFAMIFGIKNFKCACRANTQYGHEIMYFIKSQFLEDFLAKYRCQQSRNNV